MKDLKNEAVKDLKEGSKGWSSEGSTGLQLRSFEVWSSEGSE